VVRAGHVSYVWITVYICIDITMYNINNINHLFIYWSSVLVLVQLSTNLILCGNSGSVSLASLFSLLGFPHGTNFVLEFDVDLSSSMAGLPVAKSEVDIDVALMCALHAHGERDLFEKCIESVSKKWQQGTHIEILPSRAPFLLDDQGVVVISWRVCSQYMQVSENVFYLSFEINLILGD
jgi:hypothetical protein